MRESMFGWVIQLRFRITLRKYILGSLVTIWDKIRIIGERGIWRKKEWERVKDAKERGREEKQKKEKEEKNRKREKKEGKKEGGRGGSKADTES